MNMKWIIVLIAFSISITGCECQRQKPSIPLRHGPHRPINDPRRRPTTGKTITVAVIDTGFGYKDRGMDAHLCKFGHRDFTGGETTTLFGTHDAVPIDHHSHGTNIAGIIDRYASIGDANYCLVILKYFDPDFKGSSAAATLEAIRYATQIHADIINYSGGGEEHNFEEVTAVKKFLNQGGTFVAAAGNNNKDLEKQAYYPAMSDPRVVVVGNLYTDGKSKSPSSNYGRPVNRWEIGTNVEAYDITMSGTSQATAVATGKIISTK